MQVCVRDSVPGTGDVFSLTCLCSQVTRAQLGGDYGSSIVLSHSVCAAVRLSRCSQVANISESRRGDVESTGVLTLFSKLGKSLSRVPRGSFSAVAHKTVYDLSVSRVPNVFADAR